MDSHPTIGAFGIIHSQWFVTAEQRRTWRILNPDARSRQPWIGTNSARAKWRPKEDYEDSPNWYFEAANLSTISRYWTSSRLLLWFTLLLPSFCFSSSAFSWLLFMFFSDLLLEGWKWFRDGYVEGTSTDWEWFKLVLIGGMKVGFGWVWCVRWRRIYKNQGWRWIRRRWRKIWEKMSFFSIKCEVKYLYGFWEFC